MSASKPNTKIYNISLPSINGFLVDDQLYFEGICRPTDIRFIRDVGQISESNITILEKYFNDVYNLFLRKLSTFVSLEATPDEDILKLQALLQELIKIKNLIRTSQVSE